MTTKIGNYVRQRADEPLIEDARSIIRRAIITEEWHPGDKVPEGYRVVFGKLVKADDSNHHPAHQATSAAYKASSTASTARQHRDAALAHKSAARLHSAHAHQAEKQGKTDLAKAHRAQQQKHKEHTSAHVTMMHSAKDAGKRDKEWWEK